jgi:TonB family protein
MELSVYLIKVNIAILLLYGFYYLLFRNDTFFHWKRWLLLSVITVSLLYPFWDISKQIIENKLFGHDMESAAIFPSFYLNEVIIRADAGRANANFSIWNHLPEALLGIWLAGSVFFIVKIFLQIAGVTFLLAGTKPVKTNGRKIHVKKGLESPFSFFGYIVLDPERYAENELLEILRHEETHVRQWHSADMMIAEWMSAVCWFNPVVRLMKKEIRINLEYLADRSVIDAGCDTGHYQFHLLRLTYHKAIAKITNNFNVSLLKKRILMMNKKQTSQLGMAKYIFILPLVAALLVFNSLDMLSSKNQRIENEMAAQDGAGAASATKNAQDSIYRVVEAMPEFPGGDVALLKRISETIQYPEEAKAQKIEGRVFVICVITKEGKITDVKVTKSAHPLLDAEAIRCVKALTESWTPGTEKGKPVNVYYSIPIRFSLPDQNQEKK